MAIIVLTMPIQDRAVLLLDLPNVPNWWADGQMHSLGVHYYSVLRATIWKTSDGFLFVYPEITGWPRMKAIEVPLVEPFETPLRLTISWDEEGVHLRQGAHPPIPFLWPPPSPTPPQ